MHPNVVAIVGSAGKIPAPLRRLAEELAAELSARGFDLVAGGMDGVMRAVAKGCAGSTGGRLVAMHPGWGNPWQSNPWRQTTVRTQLGTMRNHLVVQAADLVVALGGGSGTLSEIAIAWQLKKPIAALTGHGGWSEKLAGQQLDKRRSQPIHGCASVQEIVAWAEAMRPQGVVAGRRNRDIYPMRVAALHRVQSPDDTDGAVQAVHRQFGMSLSLDACAERLALFDREVAAWNEAKLANALGLVTFDDGWRDVLGLQATLSACPNLLPVVFVGGNHLGGRVHPLPLQRLYHHWGSSARSDATDGKWRALRKKLKCLPQAEQHRALDGEDIDAMQDPSWLLGLDDLHELRQQGWIVAGHAHAHEDLRHADPADLQSGLAEHLEQLEEQGFTPWLAWPEGKWSHDTAKIAADAGVTLQFGLAEEKMWQDGETLPDAMVIRELWQ